MREGDEQGRLRDSDESGFVVVTGGCLVVAIAIVAVIVLIGAIAMVFGTAWPAALLIESPLPYRSAIGSSTVTIANSADRSAPASDRLSVVKGERTTSRGHRS